MREKHCFRFAAACFLLAAAVLLAAGCSDDDDPTTPDPGAPKITELPDLMLNFEVVYSEMEIDDLADLLHPDFEMILLQETRLEWGWNEDFDLDRADFVTTHTNMFGGEPGADSDGNAVHPVATIHFDLLEPMTEWAALPAEDAHFGHVDGARWASFRVMVSFTNADVSHRFLVQQNVIFYGVSVSDDEDPDYRLLGIRGLSFDKATDEASWCGVVSLYR